MTRCPVCATELQKLITRRTQDRAQAQRATDDYLRKELPKVELPTPKLTCPLCAMELQGGEAKCPRCGIPLAREEAMLECPECGALAAPGAKSCPKCGVGFEEEEAEVLGPPPLEEIPPPPAPLPVQPRPPPPPPELVTTVTAPQPSVSEGLVNGRGSSSETGLVNGTGLINGTGMTNGTKMEVKPSQAVKRQRFLLNRWQFLAVLVALVVVVSTFVYLSYSREGGVFAVDGDFGEWSDVDKFSAYVVSGSPSIDLDEWAVERDAAKLFMYFKVQGELMASSEVESFYLFMDADNSPSTGYAVSSIGAEYMLELDGWDGDVQSSSVYEYSSTSDQYDWNSWMRIGSLSSVVGGSELEAMAELPSAIGDNARFMMMSQDSLERNSLSYPVRKTGGLLVVRQEAGPAVQASGVVDQGNSVALLRLRFTSVGASGVVTSALPTVVGAQGVTTIQNLQLEQGQEQIADYSVDTSSLPAGSFVAASISPGDVSSSFSDIMVIGSGPSAYVQSPPPEIEIDGAFGDWFGKTTADSDSFPLSNPNIDMTSVGGVNTSESASFFVSVSGEMCSGSYVPILLTKPSGGGGGVIIPARKTGEDILRVYIDSDLSASTGLEVTIPSKTIGAEYLIEVRGLDGKIVQKSLMQYSSGQWTTVSGAQVNAANDQQKLEVGLSASSIGSGSMDFVIETTDWRSRSDRATAVPMGTRAFASTMVSAISPEGWIIESPTTSSSATAMSHQRKLFYDGTNFWSFFWDGANTVYKYSTDGGQTWTLVGSVFKTTGVNEVSIWYHSAGNIVYAVGDTGSASLDVYLQRGVVSPATPAITWAGSDSTLAASANSLAGKNTYISRDASGYVWVMSSNCTNPASPVRYDLSVFRSSATDSISSWIYSGNMLSADSGQPSVKGSVVPTGPGSDVWTVYGYDGNVSSRKHTGTWSTETLIYSIGTENQGNTENAPPSSVVDGNGVIHVVYGDGHEQASVSKPYIYYVYNTGSSWSVPYRLDSVINPRGNVYPTISLDSTTGNVYAFWVETNSAGAGTTIQGKKNASGTWSSLTIGGQTAGEKRYLTSVYSAPGEVYICFQWTQNTTAPIEVLFDKIPEFPTVLMPVFISLLIFAVFGRGGHTRRRKDS